MKFLAKTLADLIRNYRCFFPLLGFLMVQPTLVLGVIIPSDRLPTTNAIPWQGIAGVPGGIPHRTTVYTNFWPTNTTAQINAGLAACPSNQIVFLNAGTYNLTASLNIAKNGVTLRGAGPGQTILTNATGSGPPVIYIGQFGNDYWYSPSSALHGSIVAGFTNSSTTLITASTNLAGTSLSVPSGQLIFMDQLNDTNTSAVPVGGSGKSGPGQYTSLTDFNYGNDRWQQQVFKVVSVSGTTLTIDPPVLMHNWDSSLSPQIWWWTSVAPVERSGIEDMTVSMPAYNSVGAGVVTLQNCYSCWISNVNMTGARRVCYLDYTVRCQVEHSRIGAGSYTDAYGFVIFHSSGALVENNIVNGLQTSGQGASILLCGCSGSVFGYNYMTNFGTTTWLYGCISLHGNHSCMNLFEGNVGNMFTGDNQWGSSYGNVLFRNWFNGEDPGWFVPNSTEPYVNNVQAVTISATNRYCSVIGNILGTVGMNRYYEFYPTAGASAYADNYSGRVYFLASVNSGTQTGAYDPITYSTLIRAMNWVSATNNSGAGAGIVSGGYTSNDLSSSYYLASPPSWFGYLHWPAIDPANVSYSISRTNIPAGYRFAFGTDPPSAPTLTIQQINPTALKVLWPSIFTGWTLWQNTNLGTTNWSTNSFSILDDSTNRSVTISPSAGNLFFRLSNP